MTVRSEKAFMPHLHLPLPNDLDHEELRVFLLEHLPEERHAYGGALPSSGVLWGAPRGPQCD